MTTKLLLAPLALAFVLAPAAPASALTVCESAHLFTGDQAAACVDTTGGCFVIAATALNPPLPNGNVCQPYPIGTPPPYCDGVVGDVTAYTCVFDPSCTTPAETYYEYGVFTTTSGCL